MILSGVTCVYIITLTLVCTSIYFSIWIEWHFLFTHSSSWGVALDSNKRFQTDFDQILLHWIKLNTNTFSNTKNYNHFQLYKYMNIKIYVHLLRVKINVYSQLFVTFKCSKYFFIDTSVGHAFCFLASFIASNLAWGFPNAFMAPCSSSYNEFSLIKYVVNLRTPV